MRTKIEVAIKKARNQFENDLKSEFSKIKGLNPNELDIRIETIVSNIPVSLMPKRATYSGKSNKFWNFTGGIKDHLIHTESEIVEMSDKELVNTIKELDS